MKKTLFLSAILATALCSSAFGATLITDTTTIDGVTYNGGVYTMTGSGNVSNRTFTVDQTSDQGNITVGTSYGSGTGWQYFCSGKIAYGNTLHLGSVSADTSANTDFSPFNIGGLIVDAGTGTWTIGRNSGNNTELVVEGTGDANMTINGSVTLLGGLGISVKSGGTWDIANGKTLTLNAGNQKISVADNKAVAVTGAGTLSLSSNMNLGSGSSIAFSSTSKIGGNGKFDGSGTVELKGATGSYNNKFADTWTGTVVLTGNPGDGTNIDQLGTANSLVEFKGANGGYSNQWSNGTVNHNVRFTDVDGSAWVWGAYGTGGTQAITFAGKIDGNGHIVTDFGAEARAEGFTFSGDVSEWTGGIKQTSAGRHTVTFTGNATTVKSELLKHANGNIYLVVDNTADTTFSAAQTVTNVTVQGGGKATFGAVTASEMRVKDASTLVLTDTSYGAEIKAYSGYTGTVEVKGQTANTTINSIYQDANGNKDGVIKLVLDNGHTTTITNWTTVDSITLKNGSSIKLNNHSIGTLTMESGEGTLTIGNSNNGSGIANLAIGNGAELTLAKAMTFTSLTGAKGTLTVSKNLTVNGASTIGTLSVSGGSTITLNNHNVGALEVTGGSNKMFSNEGIGSDANHTMGAVSVADNASLTFGAVNTTVGSITLGTGSTITVGDQGSHAFDLTTAGLKVNGNANINADLVMNSGSLTFADGATLTMGCDVTIGNDVTVVLTDTMVESIMAGNDVEIIAGVDKAYLSQSLTFIGSGTLSGYVAEHASEYSLKQVGDKVYITPEPATATLSLLALAALAARRKRH